MFVNPTFAENTRARGLGFFELARRVLLSPAFLSSAFGDANPVPVTLSATRTVPMLVAIDRLPERTPGRCGVPATVTVHELPELPEVQEPVVPVI